jgi:hypothetical protein
VVALLECSIQMIVLLEFAYRLAFGLALAMAITPPRWVTSGYYRIHSYVLLGLGVLAATVSWIEGSGLPLWPAATVALLSYASAVIWLYEKPRPGIIALALVAAASLCGAWLVEGASDDERLSARTALDWLDPVAGGLVLGVTMAAMLLGHWYLNAPGMKLAPLQRLVLLLAGSLVLRGIVGGAGLALWLGLSAPPGQIDWLFLALRWLSGLVGVAAMAWMTWQTLKIPNTQSATGVLYVAVILSFIGELTAQLLSARIGLPL